MLFLFTFSARELSQIVQAQEFTVQLCISSEHVVPKPHSSKCFWKIAEFSLENFVLSTSAWEKAKF